jgi:hypothetical protein
VVAVAVLAATAALGASAASPSLHSGLDHVFVIMLENHGATPIIGDPNAPNITALAETYGQATQYYGVTHPSLPNYVAAISGSNWFVNDDNPAERFDHENLVDQLEASGHSWAAYMESMPANDKLADFWPGSSAQLYVSKHNPFVLFEDIRNDPARLANVKPYSDFQADLDSNRVADFVWITPNQCHDLHGGVFSQVGADDGTPCPFGTSVPTRDANDISLVQKADTFVGSAVDAITHSKAWTGNSAIFIVADETDFDAANTGIDQWASAAGCCDSPILPNGYTFLNSHGVPDGNHLVCPDNATSCTYGGGLVPAVIVTTHGVRGYTSNTPYNHYSLLRTIEENWHLGYLENASDGVQVQSMDEFLVH